jgi:cysteine-rich repeat protein
MDTDEIDDACDRMTCGNGIREFSEQCDDGNLVEGDGCDAMCMTPVGRVLAFFDASTVNGNLVREARAKSEARRLHAVRNMIEAAANAQGFGACAPLLQAPKRTDGTRPPPDFVSGAAAPKLAHRITDARTELWCNILECGLGFEVVVVVLPLLWLRQWRRRGGLSARH